MRVKYAHLWIFCLMLLLVSAIWTINVTAKSSAAALASSLDTSVNPVEIGPGTGGISVAPSAFAATPMANSAAIESVDSVNASSIDWQAWHGLNAADFQAALNDLGGQGYRIVYVNGYSLNNEARYAAIWEKRGGPGMEMRFGFTGADYQTFFDQMNNQGYRPVQISGYAVNGEARYAAIFEASDGTAWVARHGISKADYQAAFDLYGGQGYRLADISGFSIGGTEYYTAIWTFGSNYAWVAHNDMTADQYQANITDLYNQGFRLVHLNAFPINNDVRFNAIWEQRAGSYQESSHGMTQDGYQSAFTDRAVRGLELMNVAGYEIGGQDYYAAFWDETVEHFDSLPETGTAVPELATFDTAMQNFMVDQQIPAGTLTIMKGGKILYERGFGWQDRARTITLPPTAMMRLASVTKPFTEAAIQNLITSNKLKASDRVFCLTGSPSNCILNITPFGTEDANAVNITIQQLLDHQGGWDRDVSGDPMFDVINIANTLGVTSPPSKEDVARYMLGRALDFVPGTQTHYSNFGYLLLGLVIEKLTGKSYDSYIQNNVFNLLCIPTSDIELGHSLPDQRNAREPWYWDRGSTANVFDPTQQVMWPDGGYYIEDMAAHGGMISSGRALVQFLQGYWINGQPRTDDNGIWWFFGSLPGTHTLAYQHADGINIAVLFNKRTGNDDIDDKIKDVMDTAVSAITTWPTTAVAPTGEGSGCLVGTRLKVIDPAGGIFKSFDERASLIFPKDAVTKPISVTFTPKQLTIGAGFKGVDQFFELNAFDEHQQPVVTFQKPITIFTQLPDNLGGINPDSLKLYWLDGNKWSTTGVTRVSRVGNLLTSTTTHFSTYAVLSKTASDPSGTSSPTPTHTPTPTPTNTPTPTASNTPTSTATNTPGPTLSPTPTATLVPKATKIAGEDKSLFIPNIRN